MFAVHSDYIQVEGLIHIYVSNLDRFTNELNPKGSFSSLI